RTFQERDRLGLVVAGDLQIRCLSGTSRQHLYLDLAHPPANLQHRRAVDAASGQERDEVVLGSIEAALAIGTRDSFGESITEDRLIPSSAATVAHVLSVLHSSDVVTANTA